MAATRTRRRRVAELQQLCPSCKLFARTTCAPSSSAPRALERQERRRGLAPADLSSRKITTTDAYPAARAATLAREVLADDSAVCRLLDAGCGTGQSGEALRAAGVAGDLIGCDYSREALAECEKLDIYAQLECVDLHDPLPFEDDYFDAVVSVSVLSYLRRFETLFAELARVTRSGGVVVLTYREEKWAPDVGGVRTCAEAERGWTQKHISEPEAACRSPPPGAKPPLVRYAVYEVK